jgi:two-component system sensor histidine kinase PilS (NtrC family)
VSEARSQPPVVTDATVTTLASGHGDGSSSSSQRSRTRAPESAPTPHEVGDRLERLAALGSRAAEVAHELRNALAVLETSLHLLQRAALPVDAHGPNDERIQRHIDRMRTQVHAGQRIVREVLDEARDSVLERSDVDVRAMLLELASGIERRDGIELSIDVGHLHAFVDARQIRQLVLNLTRNAVEAVSSANCDPAHVSIAAAIVDRQLEIVVEDDGPGIDERIRDRLFQAFATNKQGGTGLGLAVCRRICEAHAGTIVATARAPSGTRIVARLGLDAG